MKILIYTILYIDRFIVALFPMLSCNRIDLQYLDHKNRKNSITRVVLLLLLLSMSINFYWAMALIVIGFLYWLFWTVKNYAKNNKL